MPDVFSLLEQDHREVKDMLSQLTAADPADQVRKATELADRLVIAESRHEAVEEMYFWPAVRTNVTGGEQLAMAALEQERESKKILDELRKTVPPEPVFAEMVKNFTEAALEHIAFEEERVWPKMADALSAEDREALGTKLAEAEKMAPTRPHPHGPEKSGGLKTVGKVAAVTDKVRDAVTGRNDRT